ncbi:MAG: glycosyltransferase family 2 protein [Butyrivibrio sp.]|uniref:glycosyltransferase family 2 protein n=1 Tax=Butyrivibrio sp. TaxID=28121 RepID=UPI0025DE7657|nr:glycosyltransferase family 2 protein [Butyrivibrio sp.]MCR5772838.1 glycosyltransferase family 2 protein [Butyrivibrio sp.]
MKLIIQIPCFNEEGTLKDTLDDLPRYIEGIDQIEYLIIDDGSSDETINVAREWGVNYIVTFTKNKGLAKGFMAGIDVCLENGADIIVNTDADNQYRGEDIEKLIEPILTQQADIVIGERPIAEISDFSPIKKKLQRLGSWAVRQASKTDIPDAPSGFRAFSREAALRLNVVNDYTYTLETIVQAGREKISITSVPIRTNPAVRPSRLAKTMLGYVRTSMLTILRAYLIYKPLKAFIFLSLFPAVPGMIIWIRFIYYFFTAGGAGHIQSLILACTLIIIGFVCIMIGILGDTICANRKILQDVQYHTRKQYYDGVKIAKPDKGEKCHIYYR